MKIVYYAHSVLSRGGDKVVLAHLGQLAAAGHQVEIMTNVVDTVYHISKAISIKRLRVPYKVGTILCSVFGKIDADMIIATIVPTAVLLAVRNSGKVLLFAQDDNVTAYSSRLFRMLFRSLYIVCFRLLALPTITVSAHLAQIFAQRYGARCQVVPNGVDTAVFYPDPSEQLVAGKEGRKALLLLSRHDPRKGFDIDRQVVSLLHEESIPLEIWTVGDSVPWPECPYPLRQFGMVPEVTLRGIMSSADVMLYPSRSEGFGLMVLEALACRCPVVASEAVTFLHHGKNALVSRVGDVRSLAMQVRTLLERAEFALELADDGYALAQQLSQVTSSTTFTEKISLLIHRAERSGHGS
jgi:glycosyltransferase involved in cell wall biosynthesis